MKLIPRVAVPTMKYFFGSRYALAAFTKKSKMFNKVVMKSLFDKDDMVVLPKDKVVLKNIKTDISIEDAGERTVLPSEVVNEMLRRADKIFIMNFCLCRRSSKCEDYPIDHGCVFLGSGTDRIPPEFGRKATSEEAIEYIKECGDLGLVHIIGRNKLDRIWLSTGKKNELLTICNCCPCCCLWNVTRNISDEIGSLFKRMETVEVTIDSEKCVGCGKCADICFTKAITLEDGKASIDDVLCRGCGRCLEKCNSDAISLSYDPESVSSEIDRIASMYSFGNKED